MLNFSKILEYLSTNQDKGKAFEHCCKWFLENDPSYSKLLKNVWLWKDWPDNWGRDKGIDLIAEDYAGKIWAIQVKAYDEKYSITKADIDTFLSESSRIKFSYRLLIATTNNIGSNAQEVMDGQEKCVIKCLLDSFEGSSVDWSIFLDGSNTNSKETKKVVSPYPHQEQALKNIEIGFAQSSYGQLHMACGTGKTLVGLWLAERLKCNATLVLVPSLSLVKQLCDEWSKHSSQDFNFYPIYVCSDNTVSKKSGDYDNDKFVSNVADLGYPVTTNPQDVVATFSSTSRPKVIFSTYHSSGVIADACKIDQSLNFDLVIADEAHRCAGKVNSEFAIIVDKDKIRAKRKLFMTATPKIFTDNIKKNAKELDYEIVSMDDHDKFGPVFHELSFSSAIKDNLLVDYQVIIPVMDNKQYQEYIEKGRLVAIDNLETDARTLASQLIVAKAIKANNLTRIISFHSRKKNAQEFIDTLPKAISLLSENEKPEISFRGMIHGEMSQEKRSNILRPFKKRTQGDIALLANVRCLSEGVDIPELDGIAFIDPKGSVIDIVQAIGRVIRKPKNKIQDQDGLGNSYKRPEKAVGTIIIPVFVDGMADEELALEQSCFRDVWKVIKALRAHDDVLAEELDSMRLGLGKRIYRSLPKFSKIHFDVSVGIGSEFADKLSIKIINHCSRLSFAKEYPELALQWHPTKNGILKPDDFTSGSNKKVWWKCSKGEDHEWDATIVDRVGGKGCSVCSGHRVVYSNCLDKTNPSLAKEWHPTKNGTLTPNNVTSGSGRIVWWICEKSHEWDATVYSRVAGNGCPDCSNRRQESLSKTHPEIAKQFHPTKNLGISVDTISKSCIKSVIWICENGHEWSAAPRDRTKSINSVCKKCVSLAYTHPNIAKEWHPTKNEALSVFDFKAGSHKIVWWVCSVNNIHEWRCEIRGRVAGINCQICSNRMAIEDTCLAYTHPEISSEWDYEANKHIEKNPSNITKTSRLRVNWRCVNNHSWQAVVRDRTSRNTKCKSCIGRKVTAENCLAVTHPEISEQWHPDKNGDLTPYNVTKGSEAEVLWLCKFGHEWKTFVYSRTSGRGCKECRKIKNDG